MALRIGILGGSRIATNMEAVLLNLGRMMEGKFVLDLLVSTSTISSLINDYYTVHFYPLKSVDQRGLYSDFRGCLSYASEYHPHLLLNLIDPHTLGFIVVMVGKVKGIRSLVWMTGDSFGHVAWPTAWKRLKQWLLNYQMAAFAYRNADAVVAVGENLRQSLINRRCNGNKVHFIPSPFDTSHFRPLRVEKRVVLKQALGLSPDRKIILFVGRLSWLKGADRLIVIIQEVIRRSNAFQFCLVGSGEYEDKFRRFPSSVVYLAGPVAHERVHCYFQTADLLLFPSRTEGMPLTILEALACQLPIIASPVGDIPNWVNRLATEPVEYVDYIMAGNWTSDKLPAIMKWENLRNRYLTLFHDLILKGYDSP